MLLLRILTALLLWVADVTRCDVILASPKNPSERVTSFAVSGNVIYFTYLDLDKQQGANGILKSYHMGKAEQSTPMKFPDQAKEVVSPISARIDDCDRLWLLDSGVQNISGHQNKELSPTLQAFHLTNNHTVTVFPIPEKMRTTESFFATFAVDIGASCEHTWVYIADFNARNLVVFDLRTGKSRIVSHHFFNPDPTSNVPLEVLYNKHQRSVSGIFGLTLAKSRLYFHPLASKQDFFIETSLLRSQEDVVYKSVTVDQIRPTEAGVMDYDKTTSVLFYAEFQRIGCRFLGSRHNQFEEIPIGLDGKGVLTDISVVGPALYFLVNNKTHYMIERRQVTELITGTTCDSNYSSYGTEADAKTNRTSTESGSQYPQTRVGIEVTNSSPYRLVPHSLTLLLWFAAVRGCGERLTMS